MRNALEEFSRSVRVGSKTIPNLRYSDDVVFIAGKMDELQELVNKVRDASIQFGLALNANKTKVMKIYRHGNHNNNEREFITVND